MKTEFTIPECSCTQRLAHGGQILKYDARIEAKITVYCDEHRSELFGWKMVAEATGMNGMMETVRQVIEKLLNGDFYGLPEWRMPKCACHGIGRITHIDSYDFSNHQRDWQELFEELFKAKNWKILHLLEEAKQ